MTTPARLCFLRSVEKRHPDIVLKDGHGQAIGRSPETKVKDKRCSRKQVIVTPDYGSYKAEVELLGANPSRVHDVELTESGQKRCLEHGQFLQLLADQYEYKIIFEPPPSEEKKAVPIKRKMEPEPRAKSSEKMAKISGNPDKKGAYLPPMSIRALCGSKSGQDCSWEELNDGEVYIMTYNQPKPSSKIAAFDMDGTLITTKSGKVFGVDHHDWKLLFSEVPGKLKSLAEDGYKLVILTNQSGIKSGKVKLSDFQVKVERIAQKLGVPLLLFASVEDGFFRKPRVGVWQCLQTMKNKDIEIDTRSSFYCGDAAGRDKDWQPKRKKDFSCSDRLFALNAGLSFYTPEELFLQQKATTKFSLPEFDPSSIEMKEKCLLDPKTEPVTSSQLEVILMVGIQGSGKSSFSESHLATAGYVVASNDKTGSRDKTFKLVESSLRKGTNVVVDNTHADKDSRQKVLEVVKKVDPKIPVRCFIMATTMPHARHNNKFRELIGIEHTKIKDPLFYAFRNRYHEPALSEGFSAIARVNFVPNFKNSTEKNLYLMYLVEK